jgi:CsoR family transcriptional regulator, copper-sensing transcriptional repressor
MVGLMVERTSKKVVVQRLGRIEGQVRGLAQMVEDDRYCIDVLTQVASATKALQGVAVVLLEDHLRGCVGDAAAADDGNAREEKLTDAITAVQRLLKV